MSQCRGCGQPLCSVECPEAGGFHHLECPLLQDLQAELEARGSWRWEIISVLRLLVTGLESGGLAGLQDHLEELRAEADWPQYSEQVVSFLATHFPHRWERPEVERAAGVLRTNAYCVEAGQSGQFGMVRIIYPLLSLMSVLMSY